MFEPYTTTIKKGWHRAGAKVTVIGEPVFTKQWWTPILDDNEEDPTFIKTAALELQAFGSFQREGEAE